MRRATRGRYTEEKQRTSCEDRCAVVDVACETVRLSGLRSILIRSLRLWPGCRACQ